MSRTVNGEGVTGTNHRTVRRDLAPLHLELIGRQLRSDARLFDHPDAYVAGVEDCLEAVARTLGIGHREIEIPEADDGSPAV